MWRNFDDVFQSFFGHRDGRADDGDLFDDLWRGDDHTSESEFSMGFPFGQTGDMFRMMDEMFRAFGPGVDRRHFNDPFGADNRSNMLEGSSRSPREQMLKQDGETIFKVEPHDKIDRDLDDTITKDNIDSILPAPQLPVAESFSSPQSSSHFKFFSSVTVRTPDGNMERRQTVRDSKGNEKTTVSKTVDGQTHVVETIRDGKTGTEEERTETSYVDDTDHTARGRPSLPWADSSPPSSQGAHPSSHRDDVSQSLFQKFFGGLFNKPDDKPKL